MAERRNAIDTSAAPGTTGDPSRTTTGSTTGSTAAPTPPSTMSTGTGPTMGSTPASTTSGTEAGRPGRDDSNRSAHAEDARRQHRDKTPAEIEREIAHTRAEMSETIDAIERKLAPERIRHEVQESVHDAIDAVQDHFSPERISHAITSSAKHAGRSMLDTIKENPLPSLVAGLSIGWLLMQGSRSRNHDEYEMRRRGSYGRPYYGYAGYTSRYGGPQDDYVPRSFDSEYDREYPYAAGSYGAGMYDEERYGEETDVYERSAYGADSTDESTTERMRHRAEEMREQVGERSRDVMHRAEEAGHEAMRRSRDTAERIRRGADRMASEASHSARQFGRQVERQARRTSSSLEHAIHENPLAAGAIAVGVGALIGSLLPSTQQENEMMGEYRDRFMDRAEHVADETMHKAEEVVHRTADEAKRAARDAAQSVAHTAQEGAREVTDTAKHEAKRQSST